MDLFMPIRFRTSVQLAPMDLHVGFADVIVQKLRENLEGVCSRFGYIRPGSIEVIKRSVGQFVKQHFNGHIRFEMICKAEVCNPAQGAVFKAVVRNKNTMGLLAESSIDIDGKMVPVLDIIVPKRAAGMQSEIDLDGVEIGDEIYISVQGKRYQLHDRKISIIGKGVRSPGESQAQAPQEEDDIPDDGNEEGDDIGSDEDYSESEQEEMEGGGDEEDDIGGGATKEVYVAGMQEEDLMEEALDDDVSDVEEDTAQNDDDEYADGVYEE